MPHGAATGELARVLIANRVGPSIARALRARSQGSAEASEYSVAFVNAIQADARAAAEGALRAIPTLHAVADALDGAGIGWMLWKGPALAMAVWGEPALRHFSDLDIVVAPSDRDRARVALETAGFRARGGLSSAQERAIHGGTAAFPLERGGEKLVELHWRFAGRQYPASAEVGDVLSRSETVSIAGRTVRMPGGADALLLLAVHATKHGWSQAEEVLSFARLAARAPQALADACDRAGREGVLVAMRLAIRLVHDLLAVDLTVTGGCSADDALTRRLAAECLARMTAGAGNWRETHAWTLAWITRPGDRARYLVRALLSPTPEEWKWIRLPDAAVALYPAVRFARLAVRAGRRSGR